MLFLFLIRVNEKAFMFILNLVKDMRSMKSIFDQV